jgi:hypothetical protein
VGGKIGLGEHRCSRPKIAHLTKGRFLNVFASITERNHERLKLERTNGDEVLFICAAMVEDVFNWAMN